MSSNRRQPTRPEIMLILDGYDPLEVREGGMSHVFICKSKIDKGYVAIKTIKSDISFDARSLRRWLDECYAWMMLGNHPNIVQPKRIHIVDDRPQLVLEYIEDSLRDKLVAERALRPEIAISYGVHVCRALQWASQHLDGFVHRDLKPENVLITSDNIAKVTDFGLLSANLGIKVLSVYGEGARQKMQEGERSPDSSLFQSVGKSQVGTIPYMSPEQIEGKVVVDIRADFYSLGCMLYEMVSGHLVFPDVRDRRSYLHAHLNKTPIPLERTGVSVSAMLCRIVHRCLEKKREKRYPDVESLSDDLQCVAAKDYQLSVGGNLGASSSEKGDAIASLIDALIKLGDLDRALELCKDPNSGLSERNKYLHLARLSKYSHDWQDVILYADKCLELINQENTNEPNKIRAWALDIKAQALEGMGNIEEALCVQREATETAPDMLVLWANLGRLQRINGDRYAALESLKISLSIGYDPQTVEQFVTTSVVIKEFDLAQREVLKAISVFGDDPRFSFLMAHVTASKISETALSTGRITQEMREECRVAAGYAQKAIKGGFFVDQSRKYLELFFSLLGQT